jgi:hypothetical protein
VAAGYFIRGHGDSWSLIRLSGRTREDIVANGLSREAAEEFCFQQADLQLQKRLAGVAAADELPLEGDIAPRRRRPKQLTFKF